MPAQKPGDGNGTVEAKPADRPGDAPRHRGDLRHKSRLAALWLLGVVGLLVLAFGLIGWLSFVTIPGSAQPGDIPTAIGIAIFGATALAVAFSSGHHQNPAYTGLPG